MTVTLRIEYQALWGSELFVYTGKKVQPGAPIPPNAIPMGNDGFGHWFAEVNSEDFLNSNYHYAVAHQGEIIASEWGKGHRIDSIVRPPDNGCLRIWNSWIDAPDDLEFRTSGFTQGIFRHPQPQVLPTATADTLTFRVEAASIRPEHKLALVGNIPELGEWDSNRAIVAEPDDLPYWRITIDRTRLHYPIYYKFILIDAQTGAFVEWEDRPNRFFEPTAFYPGDRLIVDDLRLANPFEPWRGIGTSINLNSLKSEDSCAVGEFADIKAVIDWAVQSGLKVIQVQPVNDCGESSKDPYRVSSGFALDYRYIRPVDAGLLSDAEKLERYNHKREMLNGLPKVKLAEIKQLKSDYLCALYQQNGEADLNSPAFSKFLEYNHWWLNDYCFLIAQRNVDNENIVLHDARFYQFVQFHLHKQLQEVRNYAREQGILLMGTTPHGLHKNGIDTELYREYYNLGLRDSHSHLSQVRQQRTMHPTYNWFALENSNYKLLQDRLKVLSQYFDACQPNGLLGQKQEISEFWQVITHKALSLLKDSSPILLYENKELPDSTATNWWEAQHEFNKILQGQNELMTIIPLERWLSLSDKHDSNKNIEAFVEDEHIKKVIKNILTNNKFLFS